MFGEDDEMDIEEKMKMQLLEKLMDEMDDSVGSRFKKKPEMSSVEIEVEPMGDDMGLDGEDKMLAGDLMDDDSEESRLKKRIEAFRAKRY